jgi:hypothetical protein
MTEELPENEDIMKHIRRLDRKLAGTNAKVSRLALFALLILVAQFYAVWFTSMFNGPPGPPGPRGYMGPRGLSGDQIPPSPRPVKIPSSSSQVHEAVDALSFEYKDDDLDEL